MKKFKSPAAVLLSTMILVALAAPTLGQQNSAPDNEWPKVMSGDRGEVQMYQPQLESLNGNRLEARAAVSVKSAGQDALVFGAVWLACDIATDTDTRTVTLERVEVLTARFPDADAAKVDELSRYLEQEIPKWDLAFSLDRLTASLADAAVRDGREDNLKNDAPRIHFRTHPAVLILVDGDPILTELAGYDLQYVANSMFFIVKDRQAGAYFLRGAGQWFTADDLGGNWQPAPKVSGEVAKVSQKIEADEKAQAESEKADAANLGVKADPGEAPPEIILSTVPAELIVTAGEPDFASVAGTQLLYLRNTESDVLMDIASQKYYVLISGRWYRAASLKDGPWEFVDFDALPAEFAAIPADSDMGQVLAGVAGTQQSREAVLETQIPQTAEVNRKTASCEVKYDGEPKFESCGKDIAYAVNTDKSVLLIDRKYYCVDTAVWFVAGGPEGPWQVATEVPAVVQDLPADCPVYNVKYVYIYNSTPDVVYVGYTSGYYGHYVYGPCVVYGTGWHYNPWWGAYYYPRPVTYGYGVHYSPWTGWGFTYGMSYGWLHVGVGWGRPYPSCWGAAGYRYGYRQGYWHGYNHGYSHGYTHGAAAGYRAGYHAAQRQPSANLYRDRPNGVNRTGDLGKQARPRPATSDKRNNVYADRNGDVYRDNDGKWEKREGGQWKDDRDGERSRPEDGQRDQDRDKSRDKDRDQAKPDDRQRDQSRDQSREQAKPKERQQLDQDRSSRQRGQDRQRQAPQRQAPQRQAPRGGGRR